MSAYWVLFTHYYCPLCGSDRLYTERVTDRPRPTAYAKRHVVIESWDSCD